MTTSSLHGKISMAIYAFVLFVGGLSTVFAVIAPVASADCMADIFQDAETDQFVYDKAMGRMLGLLGTLFLLAVLLMGHSTTSCLLLFLWGLSNYINFGVMIPIDFRRTGGGSEEAQTCMKNTGQSVGYFAILEALGLLFSILEDWKKRQAPQSQSNDNIESSAATTPSEETKLQSTNSTQSSRYYDDATKR